MKIASIDIGTNAIKSKIFKTTPTSIEFIEGIRSPIRLGSNVFQEGYLKKNKLNEKTQPYPISILTDCWYFTFAASCIFNIMFF